jgi:hypothetical protein
MANEFTVERGGPNVVIVGFQPTVSGWTQDVLLRSDVHWDNPKCRRDIELKHLRQAAERGAPIIDAGDLFCAMQGKFDKRSSKSSLRPEHCAGSYLDTLVSTAAEYYKPFADQFAVIGTGNHETSIYSRHETDLSQRLADSLRSFGSPVIRNGYSGWVVFRFQRGQARTSRKLWYTHGYGGGGPVTMDMIQANRQSVYVEDADVMLSGHTHDAWYAEKQRIKLGNDYTVKQRTLYQLKTPTYKDAYGDGEGGFEIEKGHPPKPLGAWWMRFTMDGQDHISMTFERAT